MIRRTALAVMVLLAAAVPLHADFSDVVRAVQSHRGMHRVWMPGLSLARLVIWTTHPGGVYDLELATFEGSAPFDMRDMEAMLRANAGKGFRPFVQVQSNRTGELTIMWARPVGDRFELMLVTHDPHDETVVLRAVVNADAFAREMDDPHHVTVVARR